MPAIAGLCLTVLVMMTGAGPGRTPVAAAAKPGSIRVFVTIQPQAYFVERVGGDRVQVEVLVGQGQCAETFEATPKQLARMSGARLYFALGMPMEQTLVPRLRGNFPELVVLDVQEGIPRRDFGDDWVPRAEAAGTPGDDVPEAATTLGRRSGGPRAAESALDEHGHAAASHAGEGLDPHTWLDPALAKLIARNIERGLARVDPADSMFFRANLRSLEADLDRVDAEIRTLLAPAQGKEMLVYHPYYGYFARAYGLRQAAIEVSGFRPGSKYLAGIIDGARREGIHAIFVQEGVALASAETVAKEIDGRVIVLDPLSRDYLASLLEMARRVRTGLLGE